MPPKKKNNNNIKKAGEEPWTYRYLLSDPVNGYPQPVRRDFRQAPTFFKWNFLDQVVCGYYTDDAAGWKGASPSAPAEEGFATLCPPMPARMEALSGGTTSRRTESHLRSARWLERSPRRSEEPIARSRCAAARANQPMR